MDPDPTSLVQIIIIVVSLLLAFLFSLIEATYHVLNPAKLASLLREREKEAKKIERLLENRNALLSAFLFSKSVCTATTTILLVEISITQFGDKPIVLIFTIIIIGLLELVLIELLPRIIGGHAPVSVAVKFAKFTQIWMTILSPVVVLLHSITKGFLSLFRFSTVEQPGLTETELKYLLDIYTKEGVLKPDEQNLIQNVFLFSETFAREVMVSRTSIEAIPIEATFNEVLDIVSKSEYSRYPVYNEDLDDICGIFCVKDLIFSSVPIVEETFHLKDYLRDAYFTYEQKPVEELLGDMQRGRINLVIVLDEYGGTSGLVTTEDLVEEIVGDIFDEYDTIETEITSYTEHEYVVDASTKINDFNEEAHTHFHSDQYETIGGVIIELLGHIPEAGQIIVKEYITFTVLTVLKNKIDTVKIKIDPLYFSQPIEEEEEHD